MVRRLFPTSAAAIAGAVAAVVVFFVAALPLSLTQVTSNSDEARYSVAAARMLATGDYLLPYAAWGEVRLVKPPLTYYQIAAGFALFGQSVFGAKVLWLVSSAVIFALTWALARGVGASRAGAAFAVAALAANLLFFRSALIHNPDIPMTLGLTLALVGAVRALDDRATPAWALAAIWGGLAWAFLAKGLLALVLGGLIVVARAARYGVGRPRKAEVAMIALAATAAFWWHAAVAVMEPAALWAQFFGDQIGDKAEFGPARLAFGLGYNAAFLTMGFLPALAALVAVPAPRRPSVTAPVALLVAWSLIVVGVFAASNYLSERYVLPAVPALAALLGLAASRFDPVHLAVRAGRAARAFLAVPVGLGLSSAAVVSAVAYLPALGIAVTALGLGALAWRLAGLGRLAPALVLLAALVPMSVLAAWPAWRTLGVPSGADIAAAEIAAAGVPNDRVAILTRWQLLERIGLQRPPIEAYRFALAADAEVLAGAEIAVAVHGSVAEALRGMGWRVETHRGAPYGYDLSDLAQAVAARDIAGFRGAFGETVFVARPPSDAALLAVDEVEVPAVDEDAE